MRTIKLLFIVLALISFISCRTKKQETQTANTEIQNSNPNLISNNNQFAFELYKNISGNQENMFYSPFSISAALAMTYTGAKGNTEKQISDVMHFAPNNTDFYNNYKAYLDSISRLNRDSVSIYSANSFWTQADYAFRKEFVEIIRKYYSGEMKNVDFIKESEKCRLEINKWVEDKTNRKIEELIKPGLIDNLTRLVLVNAIYFKAPWAMPFDERMTKKSDFKIDDATVISADFMTAENSYKYYDKDNLTAIEIPYAKGSLSMLIILPKDNISFGDLKKNINNDLYEQINAGLTKKHIKLSLPKFKTTSEFELSKILSLMGMKDAFTDRADFSGMTGKKDLMISKVVHKSFIDVNEAGTEAAAATAVIIRVKSAPVDVLECKIDHPFMFIIKENKSGSILFAGNIYNPVK